MIMITAIVTIMVSVIVSTVARYVTWQFSVMGSPLYRLVAFHAIVFLIVLAIFYDRRHGYRRSIEILAHIMNRLQRQNEEKKVNVMMGIYREHARKFQYRSILLPIAIVLFSAYILSSKMVFFAIVTSGSMQPTFDRGDMVLMQNIMIRPQVGDIIIFTDPLVKERIKAGTSTLTVTHRIVDISGDNIKTKGDKNQYVDSWTVHKSDLMGKAIALKGEPFVLEYIGNYFFQDYTTTQYSSEFLAIARTIQNMKAFGIMLFFACLALYLILSVRDARMSKHFRYR